MRALYSGDAYLFCLTVCAVFISSSDVRLPVFTSTVLIAIYSTLVFRSAHLGMPPQRRLGAFRTRRFPPHRISPPRFPPPPRCSPPRSSLSNKDQGKQQKQKKTKTKQNRRDKHRREQTKLKVSETTETAGPPRSIPKTTPAKLRRTKPPQERGGQNQRRRGDLRRVGFVIPRLGRRARY